MGFYNPNKKPLTNGEKVVLAVSATVLVGSALVLRHKFNQFVVNVAEAGAQDWIDKVEAGGNYVMVIRQDAVNELAQTATRVATAAA